MKEFDLDIRALIYKELYRVYGIHFMEYDIHLTSIVDEYSDHWLEDGCHVKVEVKNNYE